MGKKKQDGLFGNVMGATLGITGSAMTLGMGAEALGGMSSGAATHGASALGKMGSYLPMVGNLAGMGMTLNAVKNVMPKKKKHGNYDFVGIKW